MLDADRVVALERDTQANHPPIRLRLDRVNPSQVFGPSRLDRETAQARGNEAEKSNSSESCAEFRGQRT
jgi:hypothetical protein